MIRSLLTISACFALLLLGSGCARTANPSGKVTYQGKPVVWGSISLRAADGSMHQIGIDPDGTYQLEGVPVGLAKVGVSSPDPKPSARLKGNTDSRVKAPTPPPPGAWFPLPDKLGDPSSSGVTLEVGSGPADIELK
ncbi:hypothetical protein BH10PLA2_BH10PLA2_30050 [soil metagenome]